MLLGEGSHSPSYSTKNRDACLTSAIHSELSAHQTGILHEWDSPAVVIGGAADLVHALLRPFRARHF